MFSEAESDTDRRVVARWPGYVALCVILVGGYFYLRSLKEKTKDSYGPIANIAESSRTELKLAIDNGAPAPESKPQLTSIAALLTYPRPDSLDGKTGYHDQRVAPLETNIWKVEANVLEVSLRDDEDFYIVIDDNGGRTVAELPNPAFCKGSVFLPQIEAVRAQIQKEYSPTQQPKPINRRAELVGLGFFGNASNGMRRSNGARLFPLLSLRWLD